jgi:hypothetical protein
MASIKNDNARLPNWAMLVHGKTGLQFSNFYAAKNDMVEPMLERFSKWKQTGIPVNVVRLDNAGENILLKNRAASVDWKYSIKFEFTGRNTPQQNSTQLHVVVVQCCIKQISQKTNVCIYGISVLRRLPKLMV